MNETQKASPTQELGTHEKRIALTRGELIHTLFRYEKEVKDVVDFKPFLDSVMNGESGVIEFDPQAKAGARFSAPSGPVIGKGNIPVINEEGYSNEEERVIDPNSYYRCDMCGHFTKGREGKLLNDGLFVCNWCRHAEMNFDVIPKEGE